MENATILPEVKEGEQPADNQGPSATEDTILDITKQLEEELKNLKDNVLREKAENENLRKRFSKELDESKKYAVTNFARELIDVLENLQRAIDTKPKEVEGMEVVKNLFAGVEITKNSLTNIFEKNGIKRIYPLNEPFDHDFHQAVVNTPTSEHPENTCIQVIQAGYVIKDRLLRPALVAVSKAIS